MQSDQTITSGVKFRQVAKAGSYGLYKIKLRALLEFADALGVPKGYSAQLPPVGMGSITLVDQVILILLIKILSPDTIVEIGTFKGFSTRLFLDNTDKTKVFTVDLPAEDVENLDFSNEDLARLSDTYNDNYLRLKQLEEGRVHLLNISPEQKNRLEMIEGDSTKLDFKGQFQSADMVFIDGGHDLSTIASDTVNAEEVVKRGVVVWHDFGASLHTDVNLFVQDYSKKHQIFHVENSLIAFTFLGLDSFF